MSFASSSSLAAGSGQASGRARPAPLAAAARLLAAPRRQQQQQQRRRRLGRPVAAQQQQEVEAAASASAADSSPTAAAVATLHAAAAATAGGGGAVPPAKAVFAALRDLEKAKALPAEGLAEALGGGGPPGRRWRLVFTSSAKQVREANKSGGAGGGAYFPITAVQRWDASAGVIENGVFFGRIAALTFQGPFAVAGKRLAFDFDTLTLRLGALAPAFSLKPKITGFTPGKDDPFFTFFYADERICCARGRGGGVAFWARTTPQWELEKGIV